MEAMISEFTAKENELLGGGSCLYSVWAVNFKGSTCVKAHYTWESLYYPMCFASMKN